MEAELYKQHLQGILKSMTIWQDMYFRDVVSLFLTVCNGSHGTSEKALLEFNGLKFALKLLNLDWGDKTKSSAASPT